MPKAFEKHVYNIGCDNIEVMTEEQAQEKKHQVQKAIAEIEQRERQRQHGVKQEQMNTMMTKMLFEQMDVAEVYGRPRTAEVADKIGLRAGCGLDLSRRDAQGPPWDFNCPQMKTAAVRNVLQDKPSLPI